MDIDPQLFVKLMVGAFGLTFVAFVIRGTTTIAFGASTAERVSAPLFLLAIACALAGFVLGITVKVQSFLSDGDPEL